MKAKYLGMAFNLSVDFFKEGNTVIASCSALKLSTYGKNLKDAQKKFEEAFDLFLKETLEKRTLPQALKELGWKIGLKPKFHVTAPKPQSIPAGVLLEKEKFCMPIFA